jgi:hypothetical protein
VVLRCSGTYNDNYISTVKMFILITRTGSQLSVQDHGGTGHSPMVTAGQTAVRAESCA